MVYRQEWINMTTGEITRTKPKDIYLRIEDEKSTTFVENGYIIKKTVKFFKDYGTKPKQTELEFN